jgi:hypothetical protein
MATTALVTEILIVGLEVETWIALLILGVFGRDWIDLGGLSGWETAVTILGLAAAYVLGIVVDRLADSALKWLRRDAPGFSTKRLAVMHSSPGIGPFVEYQRSRFRIARGTLFNLVPASLSTGVYLIWGTSVSAWWLLALAGVTAVTLPTAARATRRIERAYEDRLTEAYEIIASQRAGGSA